MTLRYNPFAEAFNKRFYWRIHEREIRQLAQDIGGLVPEGEQGSVFLLCIFLIWFGEGG